MSTPSGDPEGAPRVVDIVVEVPRYGFVKRLGDGSVDYVSPLPAPFNYGAIPHSTAPDGDGLDVVLLGPRLAAGTMTRAPVWAVVHFVDAGEPDPKLVASVAPPSRYDIARVRAFFAAYAHAKGVLNRVRRRGGTTRVEGFEQPVREETWGRLVGASA